ncbi:MAG TPA: hypothetical protein VFX31_04125, partial [Ktedonobacterales bacterium]|nr:hypothetical protein [Ktedonobacterales bacterium]
MSHSQRISSQRVHDQRGEEDTPAHHWLRPARALWIAVVVPAYALWLAQLPAYVSAVRHDPTADAAPGASIALQLGLADLRRLDAWGLSLDVYAGAIIA